MKPDDTTIRIAPSIDFSAPDGTVIGLQDIRARIVYLAEQLESVAILFRVSPETWRQIDENHWFHLSDEVRGPCFAGGFEADAVIEVEARLDPQVLTLLALITTDLWEVGGQIRGASIDARLHLTESWFGMCVKQQRGHLETGFLTEHARF